MQLKIRSLTGRVFTVDVADDAKLENLREAIQDQQGCMPDHECLVHVKTGVKLADGWDDPLPVKELGVSAGDEIVLVLRMDDYSVNRKYEPDLSSGSWKCSQCSLVNELSDGECNVCMMAKPFTKDDVEKLKQKILSGEESRLYLDDQPGLDDDLAAPLFAAIASSNISCVVVAHTGLSATGIGKVAEACAKNANITEFEIREPKKLSDHNGAAIAVCKAFEASKTMNDFGLRYMKLLGDNGVVKGLAPLLAANSVITKLSITNNAIGFEGMKAVAAAMSSNKNCKVQELDISGQDLEAKGTNRAAEGFFSGISGALSVTSIDLSGLHFTSAAAAAFAKFVESPHCKVESFNLGDVVGEAADIAKLFSALSKCKSLKKLDARSLNLNSPVGAALAKLVADSKTLESLEANYMTGDEKNYAALGDAIVKSSSIKIVEVNGFSAETPAGMNSWLKAIKESKTLQSIAMGVQATNVDKVADALAASKSLQYFDVSWSISETQGDTFTSCSACVYFREGDDEPSISTGDEFEKHPTIVRMLTVAKKIIASHKK
eukprot:TRINITY_DN5715_c0_g1_i1.p1 TRINITY_DN5715_c0_g1~~TRINITY_DN5715_c0_g1_i1.p1  ORF type:complete len:549 (+),score=169.57 TRINITY_DN5715_c0_g1_i1:2305-3951(+)